MSDIRGRIYFDVSMERDRQDAKWGADRIQPDPVWSTILTEEVGESAEAALNAHFGDPDGTNRVRQTELRAELVQVAAVAVAWIEAIDGNR